MKIKCIIKNPGEAPKMAEIENMLKSFQSAVGGYIETFTILEDMVIICNEEGRLKNLPYNCKICGVDFVGPIIFCGVEGENFSDVPCSSEEFKQIFGI